MPILKRALSELPSHFRLLTNDDDLLRAQYREFTHQVPLLYLVLACNAFLTVLTFSQITSVWLSTAPALALCTAAAIRGIEWSRRRHSKFTVTQIRHQLQTTSRLAVVMSMGSIAWGAALYQHGDMAAKMQVVFCIGLTHVCSVLCLMPLRSAALWVALSSTTSFVVFCALAEPAGLFTEAVTLTLLSAAIIFIIYRQNQTFGNLITSQRELRRRNEVSERLGEENKRIAFTDTLSQLPNRRALLARLEDLTPGERSGPDQLAVVFIDLDGFKVVNDLYGHEAGDQLIKTVGRILEETRPKTAMLVRMGGDEFALLVEGPEARRTAEHFAQSAVNALGLPIELLGKQIKIGASIGYAVDDTGDTKPLELLRRADTAMYSVKANGRGGVAVYDWQLDAEQMRRRMIEQEIEGGLVRDEFDVVYQPIIDARLGSVTGVEALVRWPGRAGGALLPDEFIEIAEKKGSIQALGMFVLERACRETVGAGPLRLSVNVSPSQLSHPDFEREVLGILARTGFSPDRLQLEITERNLIEHPERAQQSMKTLQQVGVSFALDDFGTGFTSLAYLRSYGFSCVKIDRSLINLLGADPRTIYLVSGIIQMAKGLGVKVVAEGVENDHISRLLGSSGCHELQGYHFGRPGPLSDFDLAAENPERSQQRG